MTHTVPARIAGVVLAGLAGFAAGGCADAISDTGSLRRGVVQVFCVSREGRLSGIGSGFLVHDSRHVATNAHVVRTCGVVRVRRDGERLPLVPTFSEAKGTVPEAVRRLLQPQEREFRRELRKLPRADVRWMADRADLALLETERPLALAPVALSRSRVRDGAPVHAVGFPSPVIDVSFEQGVRHFPNASVTSGAVSNRQETGGGVVLEHGAQLAQGNSGGPLFDACGRVVGVNTRVEANRHNYSWALVVRELAPGLDALGLEPGYARGACAPGWAGSAALGLMAGTSLVAAGVALAIARRERRERLRDALATGWDSVSRRVGATWLGSISGPGGKAETGRSTLPPAPGVGARLTAVSGALAGAVLELDDSPVVIGRSPELSHLVFPADARGVSKRHCSLRYDPGRKVVMLEDEGSSYGTFLESGERLQPGKPLAVRGRLRFFVGEREQLFELEVMS